MRHLRLLIILCLVLSPLSVLGADDQYGYPIPGSYEATILGTPGKLVPQFPAKIRSRHLVLEIFPDRKKPPIFFYDKGLRCTFAWQKQKAPLVFLIPGAGSSDRADKLLTMMKAFYVGGFHVIVLPSTTNANFIISASRNCVPGDLVEDGEDLYRAMQVAWNEVKDQIEVSSFNICGFSLGGTEAAFVAKLDEERKVFNFRKVLMVNPAVSIYNTLGRIEDLLASVPGGPKQAGVFFNRMLSRFSEYYRYGNFVALNDEFLYAMYQEQLFTRAETGGLIGLTFRISLGGMIFASDVMTNSGFVVPKNRVLHQGDSLYDYFLVASHLSFFDYLNEYLFPYYEKLRPGVTKQALIDAQTLKSIEPYLKSSQKFGVVLNQNDFIISQAEMEYMKELFGNRTKVYPRGGHLGNWDYKENLDYMVGFFK